MEQPIAAKIYNSNMITIHFKLCGYICYLIRKKKENTSEKQVDFTKYRNWNKVK